MSRTLADADSAHASFAGILEQLTERGGRVAAKADAGARSRQVGPDAAGGPEIGWDSDAEALPEIEGRLGLDTFSKSGASGGVRSGRGSRAIRAASQAHGAPVVTTGRRKAGLDVAQLSYEAALRMHARRRYTPADESIFALPVRAGCAADASEKGPTKVAGKDAIAVKPGVELRQRERSRAGVKPGVKTKSTVGEARPAPEKGARVAAKAEGQGQNKAVSSTRGRGEARGRAGAGADGPGSGGARAKGAKVAAKGRQMAGPAAVSAAVASRLAAEKAVEAVRLASERRAGRGLELASRAQGRGPIQVTQVVQVAQRKAIVSLRLNDLELERLKARAAESGISVSAYMRSCVLEAEHLRAQVKQALAEMRAEFRPGGVRQEQAQLAAVAEQAGGGASWSRLLYRSATFLLGPWLAFRSSR